MTFRVVRITNNIEEYPDCEEDTEEFPYLVEYVHDETDIFIINEITGEFFQGDEFFYMVNLKKFKVTK